MTMNPIYCLDAWTPDDPLHDYAVLITLRVNRTCPLFGLLCEGCPDCMGIPAPKGGGRYAPGW